MIKALIDTNVILDIALQREPFVKDSISLFKKINEQTIQGFISATTATDIFYLLQRESGKEKALDFLTKLTLIVDILGIDKIIIINALQSGWDDFEDAVQAHAAIENNMDVIITRNTKDYQKVNSVKIRAPADFLKL